VGFQDFDDSGDNERNAFGIPKEPFAVGSGDVKLIPPPDFGDVSTSIVDGQMNVIRLTLRTITGSRKKDNARTVPFEEVPLFPVPPQTD